MMVVQLLTHARPLQYHLPELRGPFLFYFIGVAKSFLAYYSV